MNTDRTHFKKGFTPWNKGKMKMVTLTCAFCGKTVTKQDKDDGRPNRFCSLECSTKNLQRPEIIKKRALSVTGNKRTQEQRENISGQKSKLWKGGIKSFCKDCGKKCTFYAKRCNSCRWILSVGEKSPHWKGGITPINIQIRTSLEYKLWQDSILNRDGNECQKCGCNFISKLVAHHIKNFSAYPELRFAIDNGITFCRDCHKEFHKIYGKKNNSREQVIEFLINK